MKAILLAALCLLASPAAAKVNIEVHRSELTAYVYQDDSLISTYPVAMGKPNSYTPLGSFSIRSIDFNPDWRGTRGQGYSSPGRSPLGAVRMRYDGPYALHGTVKPESIGTYASLGCIRMHNKDVLSLAKLILKDTGTYQSDTWFDRMVANKYTKYSVPLKSNATITIVE
jgi:lipoprotein-anchoring transpeptidase ErfK/SrfK